MRIRPVVILMICSFLLASCSSNPNYYVPNGPTLDSSTSNFDEARVRYILLDSQLGDVIDYYRSVPNDESVTEALRQWDNGIRVVNTSCFERIIVENQGWQVVYSGTSTLVDSADILLSSDSESNLPFTCKTSKVSMSTIVFVSNRDGNEELYSINPDGTGLTRLTDNLGTDKEPDWSPDGNQIAYTSNHTGVNEIYVMNADGTNQHPLAAGFNPLWSPDGTMIVFHTPPINPVAVTPDLSIMYADGSGQRVLMAVDMFGEGLSVETWMPDSQNLIIDSTKFRGGNMGNGVCLLPISTGIPQCPLPGWMGAGGSALSEFTFTRDGQHVIFYDSVVNQYYTSGPDGSNLLPLTDYVCNESGCGLSTWSPDGQFTVVSNSENGNEEIYVISRDGSSKVNLTNNPFADNDPVWSPTGTGQTVAFTSPTADIPQVVPTIESVPPTPSLYPGATSTNPMDGATLVFIPGGVFNMGMTESQVALLSSYCSDCVSADFSSSQPEHQVQLTNNYWLYKTEVSNAQYQACVNAGYCSVPSKTSSATLSDYYYNTSYANYPVIYVDWEKANTYCQWAGGRLPTEAEWERAARGDDGRVYPWGNDPPNSSIANTGNAYGDTTAVDAFQAGASPYGVLNMAGNVWEWVADWYQPNSFDSSFTTDPQGPSSGQENRRSGRGGSFWINPGYSSAAMRDWYEGYLDGSAVGFRCLVESDQ